MCIECCPFVSSTRKMLILLLLIAYSAFAENLPNVLFIISEDLRPDLPFYGNRAVIAPNLDRLASKSVVFDLTLSQVAICAPSRASLLTGLRPDTLGIYDFGHYGALRFLRTIPSHLHSAGYQTAMSGKISHWESSKHYSRFYFGHPHWEEIQKKEMQFHNSSVTPDTLHERSDSDSSFFRDTHITDHALQFLQQLHMESPASAQAYGAEQKHNTRKPWFLGIGYKGTHLQYQMPSRFWEAYSNHEFNLDSEEMSNNIQASMAETNAFSQNLSTEHPRLTYPSTSPLIGHITNAESRFITYADRNTSTIDSKTDKKIIKEAYQRVGNGRSISRRGWTELYRGYLACLTYLDTQIGRVLDELDRLDLWKDTVIIFTSDHGMHLGEKGMWAKWSLFDEATRVPLLIHDPRYPLSFGQHYKGPVELLDLFPSIVDMTNTQSDFELCRALPIPTSRRTLATAKRSAIHKSRLATPPLDPVTTKTTDKDLMQMYVFKHHYCDPLDGTSLRPILKALHEQRADKRHGEVSQLASKLLPIKEFALTQRINCKSAQAVKKIPRTLSSYASAGYHGNTRSRADRIPHEMVDPNAAHWIDNCPFKVPSAERWPNYGVMGYSLRTQDFRYSAWLLFDVNTYLPLLDTAPLAEELYDHRGVSSSIVDINHIEKYVLRPVVGTKELLNLVNSTDEAGFFQRTKRRLRLALYDFLFFNTTHQHLFQSRVIEQHDILQAVNVKLQNGGAAKHPAPKNAFANIMEHRVHDPYPQFKLFPHGHFYRNSDII